MIRPSLDCTFGQTLRKTGRPRNSEAHVSKIVSWNGTARSRQNQKVTRVATQASDASTQEADAGGSKVRSYNPRESRHARAFWYSVKRCQTRWTPTGSSETKACLLALKIQLLLEKVLGQASLELKLAHGKLESSWVRLSHSLSLLIQTVRTISSAQHYTHFRKQTLLSNLMAWVPSLGPTWVEGENWLFQIAQCIPSPTHLNHFLINLRICPRANEMVSFAIHLLGKSLKTWVWSLEPL